MCCFICYQMYYWFVSVFNFILCTWYQHMLLPLKLILFKRNIFLYSLYRSMVVAKRSSNALFSSYLIKLESISPVQGLKRIKDTLQAIKRHIKVETVLRQFLVKFIFKSLPFPQVRLHLGLVATSLFEKKKVPHQYFPQINLVSTFT